MLFRSLSEVYNASQQSILEMSVVDILTFSEGEQLNELITALEKSLPSRSLVHAFTVTDNALMLNFSTVTKEEAAKVLVQLAAIPYISEVKVAGIVESVDETTNRTEIAFTVNCLLQPYNPEQGGTQDEVETEVE